MELNRTINTKQEYLYTFLIPSTVFANSTILHCFVKASISMNTYADLSDTVIIWQYYDGMCSSFRQILMNAIAFHALTEEFVKITLEDTTALVLMDMLAPIAMVIFCNTTQNYLPLSLFDLAIMRREDAL